MKPVLTLLLGSVLFLGCKKEIGSHNVNEYLQKVKFALKDSLAQLDYSSLDFSKAVMNRVDSVSLYLMRIPFKEKSIATDFVLVKTNSDGMVEQGKIIHLEGQVSASGHGLVKQGKFDGSIEINSLNKARKLNSNIHNGYIDAFHENANTREQTLKAADLPEVVVVAYVHYFDTGIEYATWYLLTSFLDGNGEGYGTSGGGYYGSVGSGDGGNYGGGGGGYYGTGGGTAIDPTILVDVDTYVDHPAIDIEKYLNCFSGIPDQGAICSIEIFTDIPVDSDPGKLFNWQTRSPGHTFLQLKKSNPDGTQVVMQNIGFYPQENWKNILDANPVDAKLVDDGGHEFNASLRMDVNLNQFSSALGKIKELSTMKYDMDEFNCTDFALEVFNYIRTPLTIPQYAIPGGIGTNASNTPQGLFVKLRDMKNNGDPEAGNIKLPGVKGWVAGSNGPCN